MVTQVHNTAQKLWLHVDEAHHVWKRPRPLLSRPSFPLELCIPTTSARSVQPKQTQIPGASSRESSCMELAAPVLQEPSLPSSPQATCAPGSPSSIRVLRSQALPCTEPISWACAPTAGNQIHLLQHQPPQPPSAPALMEVLDSSL